MGKSLEPDYRRYTLQALWMSPRPITAEEVYQSAYDEVGVPISFRHYKDRYLVRMRREGLVSAVRADTQGAAILLSLTNKGRRAYLVEGDDDVASLDD